jgi:protein N-lysine methyltransferase METTL21D
LELGAGLGLCGILAGALNARCVYITDGDSDSLRGMRENVEKNSSSVNTSKLKCRQLRWGMNLCQFSQHCSADMNAEGRFDTIMGSDIIYVETILEPLFQTVDALLSSGGKFILAYARRNVKIDFVLTTATKYLFKWDQPDGEEGCFVFTRQDKIKK